jgi:alpha-L-rhamnosidase
MKKTWTCSLLLLSGGLATAAPVAPPPAPVDLRCEYLTRPMGVDTPKPRFSWLLNWPGRGEHQSAYQVLVATSEQNLASGRGDAWDSGRVASSETTQIEYQGQRLASGRTYYWKVRAWDASGRETAYSGASRFDMGLLARSDWKAQWIGGGGELRKTFELPGRIERARAYVTALGYYELHLNGHRIGHRLLDPAPTTYPKRVLYSVYDVTQALHDGANAAGVMLGGGWATLDHMPQFHAYYAEPAALVQIEVELEGGKHVTIVSDESWKAAAGPILSNGIYEGEVYDARNETPGWDTPAFHDAAWPSAKTMTGSDGERSAEMMPAIEAVGEMAPKSISNPEPGVYVYDFGQNMSGWARLHVTGPRGTQVTLRYSELVYPDGRINRENLRQAKSRDIYILGGGGGEWYEPRFTYHGFRYVEVRGLPGAPSLDTVRAIIVHTAVRTTGGFAASKPVLNDIQRIIGWSQLTNLFGIPTDCDQRDERQGWMGDAQITAEEAMDNFDMAAFYTNFIRDIRDAQGNDGSLSDTVPLRYGGQPSDPAWGTAYPELCWQMWRHYGDRRILEENYNGLKKYIAFLGTQAKGDVLNYYHYGDWVPIVHTPAEFVSALYYLHDVKTLASIAAVLGNNADAQTYEQLAGRIRSAVHQKYYDPSTGNYANGTQTANAMAIAMDVPAPAERGRVAGNLQNDIVYYHDTHITTGFIGVRYLLPALSEIGRTDLAYELAAQTSFPSWGFMIANGATTLWELWQQKTGPSMNSQDHAMFGSVGAWFYETLGGIAIAPDGAGYRHIRIAPHPVEDLRWVNASIGSPRGQIISACTREAGRVTLDVTIPPGATAEIAIPKELEMTRFTVTESGHVIWRDGKYVPGDEGINGARIQGVVVVFDASSGAYRFTLEGE